MVGPVPEHDQVMSMGRSPNVVCTWVTLLKGMVTIAIIAEDVFLSTAQIRRAPVLIKGAPSEYGCVDPLLQRALPSQRALSKGSGSYVRRPKMPDSHITD